MARSPLGALSGCAVSRRVANSTALQQSSVSDRSAGGVDLDPPPPRGEIPRRTGRDLRGRPWMLVVHLDRNQV